MLTRSRTGRRAPSGPRFATRSSATPRPRSGSKPRTRRERLAAADGRRAAAGRIWRASAMAAFCGIGNPAGFRHALAAVAATRWRRCASLPITLPTPPRTSTALARWADALDVAGVRLHVARTWSRSATAGRAQTACGPCRAGLRNRRPAESNCEAAACSRWSETSATAGRVDASVASRTRAESLLVESRLAAAYPLPA